MRENLKVATPGVAMQFGTNDQHKELALFRARRKKNSTCFFFHRKTFQHVDLWDWSLRPGDVMRTTVRPEIDFQDAS